MVSNTEKVDKCVNLALSDQTIYTSNYDGFRSKQCNVPRSFRLGSSVKEILQFDRDLSSSDNVSINNASVLKLLRRYEKLFNDQYSTMVLSLSSYNITTCSGPGPKIKLRIDRWKFLKVLKYFSLVERECVKKDVPGVITVIPVGFESVIVETSVYDKFLWDILDGEVSILVPRELSHEVGKGRLILCSKVSNIWNDEILLQNKQSTQTIKDLQSLTSHTFYKCPSLSKIKFLNNKGHIRSCPLLPDYTYSLTDVSGVTNEKASISEIITRHLELNKQEITFLIGQQGSRIEFLRKKSHAIIKILPIAHRLRSDEVANPSLVQQSISITGDLQSVTIAFTLIESELSHYRKNTKFKY